MSCAHSAARSVARSAARPVNARFGPGYPAALELLWSSERWALSLKGSKPAYTGTPIVAAGGVMPGDGPSFADVLSWSDGGTLVVRWTATTASADIVGDVQVFGPVYAYSGGLKAKDGTNVATCATSWDVGDVVTAVVLTTDSSMRIEHGAVKGEWVDFDGTMPSLDFPDSAPGSLLEVQEWSKPVTKKQIDGVR